MTRFLSSKLQRSLRHSAKTGKPSSTGQIRSGLKPRRSSQTTAACVNKKGSSNGGHNRQRSRGGSKQSLRNGKSGNGGSSFNGYLIAKGEIGEATLGPEKVIRVSYNIPSESLNGRLDGCGCHPVQCCHFCTLIVEGNGCATGCGNVAHERCCAEFSRTYCEVCEEDDYRMIDIAYGFNPANAMAISVLDEDDDMEVIPFLDETPIFTPPTHGVSSGRKSPSSDKDVAVDEHDEEEDVEEEGYDDDCDVSLVMSDKSSRSASPVTFLDVIPQIFNSSLDAMADDGAGDEAEPRSRSRQESNLLAAWHLPSIFGDHTSPTTSPDPSPTHQSFSLFGAGPECCLFGKTGLAHSEDNQENAVQDEKSSEEMQLHDAADLSRTGEEENGATESHDAEDLSRTGEEETGATESQHGGLAGHADEPEPERELEPAPEFESDGARPEDDDNPGSAPTQALQPKPSDSVADQTTAEETTLVSDVEAAKPSTSITASNITVDLDLLDEEDFPPLESSDDANRKTKRPRHHDATAWKHHPVAKMADYAEALANSSNVAAAESFPFR